MLISFFNPSDLIGCGGDINQSYLFRYAEGVGRGGMRRGYAEGYVEGYAEGVHGGVRGGGMQRGYAEAVCGGGASLFVLGYHWLPIATIDLVGDNTESEV